jgi:hypothetical protein
MVARNCTLLLVLLAVTPLVAAAATPGGVPALSPAVRAHWARIERRIESGYFQQNSRGLQALAATLAAGGGERHGDAQDGEWRSYYAALLDFRLALLAQADAARAWPFTGKCVQQLDRALVLDPASAEALALQSACLALQSRLDPWRSPLAGARSLARINKAMQLAPHDPRVLLLGAEGARDRPKLFGGDRKQAFTLLKRAVGAFEAQGGSARGLPAWGAADAFTCLARDYLTRGDAFAARNILERALLVAPDFTQARRLMAEIVSG